MRRRVLYLATLAPVLGVGCNAIFGIEKPFPRDEEAMGGRSHGGGAPAETKSSTGGSDAELKLQGSSCKVNDDCDPEAPICLFQRCSPVCKKSEDCEKSERCLKTTAGVACVVFDIATCTDKDDCPAGSLCSEGTCRAGCTEDGDCLSDQQCQEDSCVPADSTPEPPADLCKPSSTQCKDLDFESCDDEGVWQTTKSCKFLCREDGCSGECSPGREVCSSPTARRFCDDEGQWTKEETCSEVCSAGKCSKGCIPGEYQCFERDRNFCRADGSWRVEETCEFVCNPDAAKCDGLCKPGSKSCDDEGELSLCDSEGKYELLTSCPDACILDALETGGARCSDCVPGTESCSGDNSTQLCSDEGEWEPVSDCTLENKTCALEDEEATCGGDCAPSQSECQGWNAFACMDGSWSLLADCNEPEFICRNSACEDNKQYTVGQSDPVANNWTTRTAFAWTLYAVPVTVPVKSELIDFRFQFSDFGPSAAMALYDDNGASAPGTLLVTSDVIVVSDDVNSKLPQASYALLPGQQYYVAVVFDVNASFAEKPGAMFEADATYPVLPDSVPFSTLENYTFPIFITVRELAE